MVHIVIHVYICYIEKFFEWKNTKIMIFLNYNTGNLSIFKVKFYWKKKQKDTNNYMISYLNYFVKCYLICNKYLYKLFNDPEYDKSN